MTRLPMWAGLMVALCACRGTVLPPGADRPLGPDSPYEPVSCDDGPHVDDSPLVHLTRSEYEATIADLLGVDGSVARSFAPNEDTAGFEVGARVSPLLAEQYIDAAEEIAREAVATRLDDLLECDRAQEETCARSFIERFALRAFRRPPTSEEIDGLVALYRVGREYDFATGIEVVIAGALSSPSFLYRVELDPEGARSGDIVPADDFVVASRLSYFLYGSMPDDALFAAAAAGQLSDPAGLEAETRRMLEDERSKVGIRHFYREWLGLGALDTMRRDPELYPEFDLAMGQHLRGSLDAFIDDVYTNDASVDALLAGSHGFVNGPLASIYGVEGVSGDAMMRVELPPDQRAGILTHPALLAVLSKPNQSDPIHRGLFVRQRLLCQQLPPPPDDIAVVAPDPAPGLSTRERFAQHSTEPRCQGCHQLMDPIGFGFEHYDALGRYRETDEGQAVDASGEVLASEDADGAFVGVPELAERLAGSTQVRECVAVQWLRYAVGRTETYLDACSVAELQEDFASSGYDMRELLVAVVRSDAFRYRRAPSGVIRE
jgi:hypothetical protein